jgi:hypothetical protein
VEDDDQVTGKVCETFVAAELLKRASWEDVDLVLESRRGDIAAVEVKARATITRKD